MRSRIDDEFPQKACPPTVARDTHQRYISDEVLPKLDATQKSKVTKIRQQSRKKALSKSVQSRRNVLKISCSPLLLLLIGF